MQDASNGGARSSRQSFSSSACQERRVIVHCELGGRAAPVVSEKIGGNGLLRDSGFRREPIVSLGTKMPNDYRA